MKTNETKMPEFWAYIAGWEAWFAGVSWVDNPYGAHGQQSQAWRDGWEDAE